jgi:hypothetical protein
MRVEWAGPHGSIPLLHNRSFQQDECRGQQDEQHSTIPWCGDELGARTKAVQITPSGSWGLWASKVMPQAVSTRSRVAFEAC